MHVTLEVSLWMAGKLQHLYWDSEFIRQSIWYWIDVAYFYDKNTTQQVAAPDIHVGMHT